MKTCFKCHIIKPLTDFYPHPRMADGHLNKCKDCAKKDTACREARMRNNREWLMKERERCRIKSAIQRASGVYRGPTAEVRKRWYENNRHKVRAQQRARRAMKIGLIPKVDCCSECGALGRLEMHHPDYSQPLLIQWLCVPCHGKTRRLAA